MIRGDRSTRAHRVRIIGGVWKRTPLPVPDVEGLRPSPDRIRETLFNWLGQDLEGWDCLDLFAGSGALGLEAASRGAASVVLVERNRAAAASIRTTIAKLQAAQAAVIEADALIALESLHRSARRFDLVFLDPPYRQDWLERALPRIAGLLNPAARLYVESEAPLDVATLARWFGAAAKAGLGEVIALKAAKAGQVHYHLFQIGPSGPGEP
jgi:16S rRNA (guanine966-N2)-methyltransferase